MATTTVPATTVPSTTVPSTTGPTITDRRTAIDELDAQLVDLIRRRLAVSHDIQQQRLAAGGPRVVHSREAEVVARWRAELGAPGSRIALALLELARGSVVAP